MQIILMTFSKDVTLCDDDYFNFNASYSYFLDRLTHAAFLPNVFDKN